jgi:hypothetical protein
VAADSVMSLERHHADAPVTELKGARRLVWRKRMPESPRNGSYSQNHSNTTSLGRKLRDFVTSTAGLMTGIAAIVTAAATITGVLLNGNNSPVQTIHRPATPTTGTTAPTRPSPAASATARIQWGPGDLLVTNDGTSLSSVPPGNPEGVVGDIYAAGSGFSPFSGTTLVLWTAIAQPTAQQCQYLATTQGNPGQGVNVVPGSVVCAVTSEGQIAIMRVISINAANYAIETKTTVWDLPGS